MDKALKDEWTSALRSGEYPQGLGALNVDHEKYCCLGVLCDLMVKRGQLQEHESIGPMIGYSDIGNSSDMNVDTAFLPRSVCHVTGLTSDGLITRRTIMGADGDNFQISTLAEANDAGMTFEQIADIIDQEF